MSPACRHITAIDRQACTVYSVICHRLNGKHSCDVCDKKNLTKCLSRASDAHFRRRLQLPLSQGSRLILRFAVNVIQRNRQTLKQRNPPHTLCQPFYLDLWSTQSHRSDLIASMFWLYRAERPTESRPTDRQTDELTHLRYTSRS